MNLFPIITLIAFPLISNLIFASDVSDAMSRATILRRAADQGSFVGKVTAGNPSSGVYSSVVVRFPFDVAKGTVIPSGIATIDPVGDSAVIRLARDIHEQECLAIVELADKQTAYFFIEPSAVPDHIPWKWSRDGIVPLKRATCSVDVNVSRPPVFMPKFVASKNDIGIALERFPRGVANAKVFPTGVAIWIWKPDVIVDVPIWDADGNVMIVEAHGKEMSSYQPIYDIDGADRVCQYKILAPLQGNAVIDFGRPISALIAPSEHDSFRVQVNGSTCSFGSTTTDFIGAFGLVDEIGITTIVITKGDDCLAGRQSVDPVALCRQRLRNQK